MSETPNYLEETRQLCQLERPKLTSPPAECLPHRVSILPFCIVLGPLRVAELADSVFLLHWRRPPETQFPGPAPPKGPQQSKLINLGQNQRYSPSDGSHFLTDKRPIFIG